VTLRDTKSGGQPLIGNVTSSEGLILTLNGGSSSLKFALYDTPLVILLRGHFERLGQPDSQFRFEAATDGSGVESIGRADHSQALDRLFNWLNRRFNLEVVGAVGHRIVHGGPRYRLPARIDDALVGELRKLSTFAPEHLPTEIEIIEQARHRLGQVPQVACFDTSFHRDLPATARILPIPRRFREEGVERYGFHGLSYTFLLEELRHQAGEASARGRLILAHLGNGVSLAAVRDGRSIDTTMAFTPAGGVPMGTRSGDLDPGLFLHLVRQGSMDAQAFDRMVNHESGLLGISETSSDVRDLLKWEATDSRAAEAIALFCYRIKQTIGAFAAALGGIDVLVFTGGIGENAGEIRQRICTGLDFLGISLDSDANAINAPVISAGRVDIRVIATDEEAVIARAVQDTLKQKEPDQ
jgi:acetate kinase